VIFNSPEGLFSIGALLCQNSYLIPCKTDESIGFLAKLAGIEEKESISKLEEFKKGGFCEFQGAGGEVFTIRKTDRNDDRYRYVEGFHADIAVHLDAAEAPRYISFVGNNYNVGALSAAADYFDVTPVFDECGIYVNRHKKLAETDMRYAVKDVAAVRQKMTENIKSNWYDAENGKMGLSYGMIDLIFLFDGKGGNIYVTERSGDLQTALGSYKAPEVSLATLGFQYAEKDALCIYEDKGKNISIAIHKPEWGSRDDDWNLEYLHEVNGYLVGVWYDADKKELRIQADKGGSGAGYRYFIASGKYGEEYPDPDTVKKHFGSVFGTQDANVLGKPVSLFEQTLQERFGMDLDELYALPIR